MKLTPEQIQRLQGRGAKVTRMSKAEPVQPPPKPEPVQPSPAPKPVESPSMRREDRLAITQATAESKRALKSALDHADKISQALHLSTEQSQKLLDVLVEIERERNKPKRAIINRSKSGDKLIESVDFITL